MLGNKAERLVIKQLYETEDEVGRNNGMKHQELYYNCLVLELFLDVIFCF
jgi:hypothetical protein